MNYHVIRSRRRTVSIEVTRDGRVTVRAPLRITPREIDLFIRSRSEWISRKLQCAAELNAEREPAFTDDEIAVMTAQAKRIIPDLVSNTAKTMGLTYGKVFIRHQRSRWGSCSAKGNLNFNCLLVRTPPKVMEYVVIHELAHIRHMNHSEAFWTEVERYCPDYRQSRSWLRGREGQGLIYRLG